MAGFAGLLQTNRNYRYTWMGQVVSEIGDHFNNIAVFALALATTQIRAWWSPGSCWRAPSPRSWPVRWRASCSIASTASAS